MQYLLVYLTSTHIILTSPTDKCNLLFSVGFTTQQCCFEYQYKTVKITIKVNPDCDEARKNHTFYQRRSGFLKFQKKLGLTLLFQLSNLLLATARLLTPLLKTWLPLSYIFACYFCFLFHTGIFFFTFLFFFFCCTFSRVLIYFTKSWNL